jgi:hypothetical protein
MKGRLLHWHEIPTWQHDNEFILSGYRCGTIPSMLPPQELIEMLQTHVWVGMDLVHELAILE